MGSRVLSRLFHTRKVLYDHLNFNKSRAITYSQLKQTKQFSTIKKSELKDNNNEEESSEHNLSIGSNSKYKVFEDEDSQVIFDVTEERRKYIEEQSTPEVEHDPYEGINLEHGKTGVFDIDDLVTVLKKDNAKNIFVAIVPKEFSYVDYIVVVTGKSLKHMSGLATFVRKVYKLKRYKGEVLPKIEGEKSKDWMALDLGNIALHILSHSARTQYDLETLWSVGPEHDDQTNMPDDINIMDQYNAFLADLEPGNTDEAQEELK